jgi:hypothetical protein
MKLVQFVIDHKEAFLPAAIAIWSEVLGANPKWKSNSVVQLISNILKGK